jgi:TP901 family phage tail tape measure protein
MSQLMNDYQQEVALKFEGEDNLSKVVDNISERISNMQTKVMAANLGLGGLKKVTGDNVTTLEKFGKQIAATDKLLMKAFNVATFAKIGAVLADGIKNATRELSGFSTGIKAFTASGYTTQIIDDFTKVRDAILGSKEAVDQFSLQALTAYNRYKKAQTEVEVLFSKGSEFIGDLSKNIQNLVNNDLKNAISSIDALGAAYQAASASFTEASENTAVMTAGLKLAKAGGADTGATMKVLTQTIRAYNMSATDSNKVAAVLNKTIQLGITTMPELANGFAQSAVTANAAKVKLEELAAGVAALTLQGFDTPSALTGLEALFRNIINKTPQAEAALRSLRDEVGKPIRFDIAEIKTKGFAKALDDLNKAAKGNAETLATIIPEATAYNTALALMSNNAQQLKDNSKSMFEITETGKKARETLDEVFGIKISSQAEKFDAIINRITEQFIQFGEQIAPFFQVGVDVLEKTVSALSSISPEMKKIIAQWIIFQMGAGQVTNAIGQLVGAATQAFMIFQGWRIFTGLFNGELLKQVKIVQELAKANIGLLPVVKQVIGIDQQHLLLGQELNLQQLNRFQIIGKLREQNLGLIAQAKQLIGIDQSHLLVGQQSLTLDEQREEILNRLVEQNKDYKKVSKELSNIEKEHLDITTKVKEAEDKLSESYTKLAKDKYDKSKLEKELNSSTAKSADEQYQLAERYQQQQELIAKSEAELAVNKKNKLDLDEKAAKLQQEVADKTAKAEKISQTVKDNTLKIQKAQTLAEELQRKAVEARTLADLASSQAQTAKAAADAAGGTNATLNAAAEVALANATTLETAAEVANTTATNANNAARTLGTTLATEQGIAEGRLIKIRTLAGEQIVKNTLLNRMLGFSFKDLIPKMDDVKKTSGNLWTNLNKPINFSGIKDGVSSLFSKLSGMLPIVGQIGTKLLTFAPILLPVAGAAALLYDQFAGTSAQVRKLQEDLTKINKELEVSKLKTLQDLDSKGKLSYEMKKQLIMMEHNNELAKLNGFENTKLVGIWENIGNAIGAAFNGVIGFGKAIFDMFDKILPIFSLYKAIRYDQVISTFSEIEAQIEKTSAATLKFAEVNSKLKQGFTDIEKVNKKIREGKSLEPDDITKLKNQAEERLKLIDDEIAANDRRLEALKEKLKDYDALDPEKQKQAAAEDQDLASRRDVLEAQNENLKKQRQINADTSKANIEYLQQRNIFVKRLQEANPNKNDPNNKKNDFLDEDFEGQVGNKVNSLQVRMRRSFRQSNEDLQEYAKKVEATLDGTNKYIDREGKEVKLDVTQLGQYVQDFDKNVETTVAGIGQLYEGNYINAKEANEKLQAVLNQQVGDTKKKVKDLFSTEQLQEYYAQIIEYSKNASKKQIDLLSKDAEIQQQLISAGVKSQIDGSKEIRKIQQQQLKAQIDDLEKTLQLQLDIAPALKQELEKQLKLLKAQFNAADKEDQRKSIDERYQQQQVALDKEVAAFKLSRAKFVSTEKESIVKLEQLQKQQLLQQQNKLQEQLKLVGNDKEERTKLETELLNLQLQYQQIVTSSLQREFDKRNKQLSNDIERQKLEYGKLTRTLSSTTDSLQEELKIIEARNKSILAANQYETSRLQNQLRVTADIEKRADIEVQLVELKNKNSEVTLAQEAKSLQYQQKLVDLGFQKQQIELDINKLQNESQRKLLELELKRALEQKQSKEEIETLQTKLDINIEESKSLESKSKLQQEVRRNQLEINNLTKQDLEYKLALTREGGELDVEIAKQNRVLATYEKQAQQAKVSAELAEISANKQLVQNNLILKSYENRINLTQKQLDLEQQQQNNTQRMFKLAGDLATTDYQKQEFAKLAARQELMALDKKQEIEKQLLEIQIKSNNLALQRQEIEQKTAELKLAAELKVQIAETKKVLASKTATNEDKAAASAQLEAKQFAYEAKLAERPLLEQQRQLSKFDDNIKRYQLQQNQSNEVQDKSVAYAKTTFGIGDDMEIYRAIRNNLASVIDDVTNEINNKDLNYNKIFSNSNVVVPVAPKLTYDTVGKNNIVPLSNNTNTISNDKQVVINFTNTNDVTIEGNASSKEVTNGIKDANDDAIKKLYDVFRKTNVELGNK